MKKIGIALLFLLTLSCRDRILHDKAIVSEVDLIDPEEKAHEGKKYEVYLLTVAGDMDPVFYTNDQYKVGDTIYFSTKPQPCQEPSK